MFWEDLSFMHATANETMAGFEEAPAEVQLLVRVLKFATLLDRPMLDGVATPERIGLNELRVLMSLAGEGSATGAYLSRLLSVPAMNVSRALSLLERQGWVEHVPDETNRRRKPFGLSSAGNSALQSMIPELKAVADFIFADLTAKDRQALEQVLEKMGDRAAKWPNRPATRMW